MRPAPILQASWVSPMKIKRILCSAALALVTAVATAQTAPAGGQAAAPDPHTLTEAQIKQSEMPQTLFRLAAIYKQSGDLPRLVWSLQRLNALVPNSGELKLALASVYAQQGDSAKTYETLLHIQQQGFGYDIADNPAFAKVAGTKVWKYVSANLKANLAPFGEGKVAFTLPKGDYLFESLAYDPKKKQFLAGSVREGKVYRVGKDGKLDEFIAPTAENGLWGVYAIAVDADNDALYVASTNSVYFRGFKQEDFGKAGVFKFSLSSGKLIAKYLLTADKEARTLSTIALGKNGQVFAADGVRNIIYRVDGGALKVMVENPKLTSIRGLAVSGDGKRLYFADYSLGIFGVDLAAGKGFDLGYQPDRLVLGGIDGLYWYDDALVAIENGMSPRRVIRLRLDADGRSVAHAMPIDAGNAAFALPTYGAVDGDSLYFVANSQKGLYDQYGVLKDASKLEATKVFKSDLRFAWDSDVGRSVMQVGAGNGTVTAPMAAPAAKPGGTFGNVEGGVESNDAAKPSGH
jgi:sugar lactone lactonase YvrE